MSVLAGLKPEKVFEYFEYLSSVPHGSGNTGLISDLCVKWANDRGIYVEKDKFNDIIMRVPASEGRENEPGIIIQGHLDMVCTKTDDCELDMAKDAIRLMQDGEYVWADKTSLGGDDLVAVAVALAILEDKSISHPPLEALFTVDEETGLVGANKLDGSRLNGKELINIDSEEVGVITVSCAGGIGVNVSFNSEISPVECGEFYEIAVSGLIGGHSGAEIHLGRANAIHLVSEVVEKISKTKRMRLASIVGGSFENVIPSSATAIISVPRCSGKDLTNLCYEMEEGYKKKYPDKEISITATKLDKARFCFSKEVSENIIGLITNSPDGVQKMSESVKGLVETSLNLGTIRTENNKIMMKYFIRSSVNQAKVKVADDLVKLTTKFGAKAEKHDNYSAWEYKKDSKLREKAVQCYKELYGKYPKVEGIHAGLECGILAEKIRDLDAISIGPNLKDIHSVNEKLEVKSVEIIYNYVKAILEKQ